jgi:hypothetical protein
MTDQRRRVLLWVVLVLLCVAIVLAVVVVRQVRRVERSASAAPTWMVLPAVRPHLVRAA